MYITLIKFFAPVVLIIAGLWRYDYITTQNERIKADLSAVTAELEQSQAIITKERQNAAKSALLAEKAYEEKQHDKTELESLRACVADKSCGVRVVRGACPQVPGSSPNAGGAEAAHAADRAQFEQDYFALLESIKETRRLYNWMQQELIARSAPDYCNIK